MLAMISIGILIILTALAAIRYRHQRQDGELELEMLRIEESELKRHLKILAKEQNTVPESGFSYAQTGEESRCAKRLIEVRQEVLANDVVHRIVLLVFAIISLGIAGLLVSKIASG